MSYIISYHIILYYIILYYIILYYYTHTHTVEPGCNNIGLYETWSTAADTLWYQLIPYC